MALTACLECGKEISDKARACPHCGFESSKSLDFSKFNFKLPFGFGGCLGLLFGFIALTFVFSLFDQSSDEIDYDSETQKALVYRYAVECVKESLVAPSTASFPTLWERTNHVYHIGEGTYRVNSWVDSENRFSAKVRSNFSVLMVGDGEKYFCRDLNFEE